MRHTARLPTRRQRRTFPPSAQRLEHFIWLKDPSFTLHAWNGTVKEVEEIPGGVAVLLAVIPTVRHQGQATAVGDLVLEKYAIVNGQVQFLGTHGALSAYGEARICSIATVNLLTVSGFLRA